MPICFFQWLRDLTGPKLELTEAFLAAFSQLPEVAPRPEPTTSSPGGRGRAAALVQCPPLECPARAEEKPSVHEGGAVSELRVGL